MSTSRYGSPLSPVAGALWPVFLYRVAQASPSALCWRMTGDQMRHRNIPALHAAILRLAFDREDQRRVDAAHVVTPGLLARGQWLRPDATLLPDRLNDALWRGAPSRRRADDSIRALFLGPASGPDELRLIRRASRRRPNHVSGWV